MVLIIEDRPALIATCSKCRPYWDFELAHELFDLSSRSMEENDRRNYLDDREMRFLQATAKAARTSGCLCAFWEVFAAELCKYVKDPSLNDSDKVPQILLIARQMWSEHNDFVPVLEYLSRQSGRAVIPIRVRGNWEEMDHAS